MAKPLDVQEESLADLLGRAGLPAAPARVFAALARGGAHTATDLAAATGLTRQDAGDAAHDLAHRGLARVEKLASGPRGGRPTNRYFASGDGLGALVQARRSAIERELEALDALERLERIARTRKPER